MKKHWFQYLIDSTNALALEGVRVHVFLTDQTAKELIMSSNVTDNVLVDIPEDYYAYIGLTKNETVSNFDISKYSEITTDSKGFFEFWVSDYEDTVTSKMYEYNQNFTVAFVKSGMETYVLENLDIFGIHYEVDEADTSTTKNKSVSNKLIKDLIAHQSETYAVDSPHGVSSVDITATTSDDDYALFNKTISNKNGVEWESHKLLDYDATPHGILQVDETDLPEDLNHTNKNKLVSNQLMKKSIDHVDASIGVHGIGATGSVVGTDTTQTLTNKTITNLATVLAITDGGTGANSVSSIRSNLGFLGEPALASLNIPPLTGSDTVSLSYLNSQIDNIRLKFDEIIAIFQANGMVI